MVYKSFLELQSDYIFLIYGLSFFLLAHVCLSAGRRAGSILPWKLLGLFAIMHGTHELLDMTALALGDSPAFSFGRFLALAASFAMLLEFGRIGAGGPLSGRAGRLILPLLLAASVYGARHGVSGLDAAARYAVGLTGGIWASVAVLRAAVNYGSGGRYLRLTGIVLAVYALFTGLVVDQAPFFPADTVNYASFQDVTGVPVQLVRLALMLSSAVLLIIHFRSVECGDVEATRYRPHCSFRPVFILLSMLAVGWAVTDTAGRHVEDEARKNLTSRTLTAAASILPEHVAKLTGTPADEGTPAFEELRDRLLRIKAVNPDCRFVYLMGLRGDQEIFLVDAEPKDSEDYSVPGDVYPDATPQEIADFRKGRTKVYEPYTDSWGTWVSGVSFIRNPYTGEVAAMLGMDIDAKVWLDTISMTRYFCMVIIFILSVLTIVSYDAWQRDREAAEQAVALRLANQRLADEKKLRDLVNSLGEGVIVQDAGGAINFANPEAERILGWDTGELTGRPIAEALGCIEKVNGGSMPGQCLINQVLSTGESHREEDCIFTRKDGSKLSVSFVSSPVMEEGRLTGVVTAFQDISERKKMERQKSDFYAMVTHDLKSPLMLIQGYSDMLLEYNRSKLDEDSIGLVENIRKSGTKILGMVNDFLTVSRLESGNMTMNEGPEDMDVIVRGVLAELAPVVRNKSLSMDMDFPEAGLPVICDGTHIQRAVTNLVLNAVNYTPEGGSVRIALEEAGADESRCAVVSVSDTGPGIPVDERDKIFNKYYRSPKTSGLRGSGLGLAIVKAVADAHGGRVELESEDGRGSTFRLVIPAERHHI